MVADIRGSALHPPGPGGLWGEEIQKHNNCGVATVTGQASEQHGHIPLAGVLAGRVAACAHCSITSDNWASISYAEVNHNNGAQSVA